MLYKMCPRCLKTVHHAEVGDVRRVGSGDKVELGLGVFGKGRGKAI